MRILITALFTITGLIACKKESLPPGPVFYAPEQFVMGGDLSYVNQILDHGGIFRDSGEVKDPYLIFQQRGTNVARFRLFHDPVWTKELYDDEDAQMYNDFEDVKKGIARAKALGMQVCLDFHYSDTWADPGHQVIPEAWQGLSPDVLADSLYNYTYNTLKQLDKAGLMPEYVQPGNEINPGMLLPIGNRWSRPQDFFSLLRTAIRAIRKAGDESRTGPKIILHIAQPENVEAWFSFPEEAGEIDYDIIGFSYYYIWSGVPLVNISDYIRNFRIRFGKEVMIMETAYPWTLMNADKLPNIIAPDKLDPDFPANRQGQLKYMEALTQEIFDGGGKGIFYWEPDWITSHMRTRGGEGSAWDCNAFFDFSGNPLPVFDFMTKQYGSP